MVSDLALFEITKIMKYDKQIEERLCHLITFGLFETASILAGFPEANWKVTLEPKWIICHADASYGEMKYECEFPPLKSVSDLALFEATKIMMHERQIEGKLCFLNALSLFETASILAGFPETTWEVDLKDPGWILCHAAASYGRLHYQYKFSKLEE